MQEFKAKLGAKKIINPTFFVCSSLDIWVCVLFVIFYISILAIYVFRFEDLYFWAKLHACAISINSSKNLKAFQKSVFIFFYPTTI